MSFKENIHNRIATDMGRPVEELYFGGLDVAIYKEQSDLFDDGEAPDDGDILLEVSGSVMVDGEYRQILPFLFKQRSDDFELMIIMLENILRNK